MNFKVAYFVLALMILLLADFAVFCLANVYIEIKIAIALVTLGLVAGSAFFGFLGGLVFERK